MMKRVGVFDSGIGGFSILKQLFIIAPEIDYFYIADTEFCPYGEKSEIEILQRSRELTQILLKNNVDAIVLACNTATAYAIDKLRIDYPEIKFIGVEPYVNAINKLNARVDDKWLSLTTRRTAESKRYHDLLNLRDPNKIIETKVISELVPLIEDRYYKRISEGNFEKEIAKLLKCLEYDKFNKVILGCTHYPLIKGFIERFLNVEVVDPSFSVAMHTANVLKISETISEALKSFHFYCTSKGQWEELKRNHLDLFD